MKRCLPRCRHFAIISVRLFKIANYPDDNILNKQTEIIDKFPHFFWQCDIILYDVNKMPLYCIVFLLFFRKMEMVSFGSYFCWFHKLLLFLHLHLPSISLLRYNQLILLYFIYHFKKKWPNYWLLSKWLLTWEVIKLASITIMIDIDIFIRFLRSHIIILSIISIRN